MPNIAQPTPSIAPPGKPRADFMKTLLSTMRVFHYVVGITAPDKKHEKQILLVWIGLFVGLMSLAFFFTRFIIPQIFK